MASTTRPTASRTRTARATTGPGTAARRGPAHDPGILALRARQSRAMLATLLLSAGIPMLLGGDEIGRTQQGNNNAYCQDNEISWFDWSSADTGLLAFTRRLIELRTSHPVFRRRRFLTGADAKELGWFTPGGTAMTDADWDDGSALAVAIYLDGSDSPDRAADGHLLLDDDFYLMVNAWWEPLRHHPRRPHPGRRCGAPRQVELSSYDGRTGEEGLPSGPGGPDGPDGPDGLSGPSAPAAVQPRPAHRRPPLPHRAPRPLRLAAADSGSVLSHIPLRDETRAAPSSWAPGPGLRTGSQVAGQHLGFRGKGRRSRPQRFLSRGCAAESRIGYGSISGGSGGHGRCRSVRMRPVHALGRRGCAPPRFVGHRRRHVRRSVPSEAGAHRGAPQRSRAGRVGGELVLRAVLLPDRSAHPYRDRRLAGRASSGRAESATLCMRAGCPTLRQPGSPLAVIPCCA